MLVVFIYFWVFSIYCSSYHILIIRLAIVSFSPCIHEKGLVAELHILLLYLGLERRAASASRIDSEIRKVWYRHVSPIVWNSIVVIQGSIVVSPLLCMKWISLRWHQFKALIVVRCHEKWGGIDVVVALVAAVAVGLTEVVHLLIEDKQVLKLSPILCKPVVLQTLLSR